MKKSSYQKLKQENLKLKTDIYNLVMKEQSFDSLQIREAYRMKFGMQDQILLGYRQTEGPFIMGGFIKELSPEGKEAIQKLVNMPSIPPMRNEPKRPEIPQPE